MHFPDLPLCFHLQDLEFLIWISMPVSYCWNFEPFLFAFGLVTSAICCGIETRSRSRSRITRRTTNRSVDDIIGIDIPDQLPISPRRVRQHPSSPPLTVYTEYRYQTLPPLPQRSPQRPPTSPVSSRDNAERFSPQPIEATSQLLRSQSLPPKKRRRRHHRSHRNPIIAPITFTPTVTHQEAPQYDDSSSSSTARPMASPIRPTVRTPPAQPPPKVDPDVTTSKGRSSTPTAPVSTSKAHQSSSAPNIRENPVIQKLSSRRNEPLHSRSSSRNHLEEVLQGHQRAE